MIDGESLVRVGYLEGTDPLLLTKLAVEGIETLPVANTWDGHGKPINHLSEGEVNVVVGYLHKLIPTEEANLNVPPHARQHARRLQSLSHTHPPNRPSHPTR